MDYITTPLERYTLSINGTFDLESSNGTSTFVDNHYGVNIFNYIIGSLGVMDNLFVIVVMLGTRSLRVKLSNMFIINQSLIDCAASIFLIVKTSAMKTDSIPYGDGLLGQIYCRLWVSDVFLWGLFISSTYNIVALTVERFMAVVYPVLHRPVASSAKRKLLLIIPWLLGICYELSYVVPTSYAKNDFCYLYKWADKKILGVCIILAVEFVIPLIIFVYCYVRIVRVIKKKITPMPVIPKKTEAKPNSIVLPDACLTTTNQHNQWRHAKRKTLKIAALVTLCFVLCWICNQILYAIFNLELHAARNSTLHHITEGLVYLNCCINPLIYAFQFNKFQIAVKEMFECKKYSNQNEIGRDSVITNNSIEMTAAHL